MQKFNVRKWKCWESYLNQERLKVFKLSKEILLKTMLILGHKFMLESQDKDLLWISLLISMKYSLQHWITLVVYLKFKQNHKKYPLLPINKKKNNQDLSLLTKKHSKLPKKTFKENLNHKNKRMKLLVMIFKHWEMLSHVQQRQTIDMIKIWTLLIGNKESLNKNFINNPQLKKI